MKKWIIGFLALVSAVVCAFGLAACKKSKTPMPTPQMFRMVNGNLFWEAVEGANGYTLEINGEEISLEETYYIVKDVEYNVEYLFRVKANGNKEFADSEWAELTYTFEEAATVGLNYTPNSDNRYYSVSGTRDLSGKVVIPSRYNNLPVRVIEMNAFFACENITEIIIPSTITTIDARAFENCTGLTEMKIPSSVTTIGRSAFSGCTQISEFNISDAVTDIGYNAFRGTAWMEKQADGPVYAGKVLYTYKGTMPEGTVITNIREDTIAIGSYAFYMQQNLVGVTIPSSVRYLRSRAFCATGLTDVTFTDGLLTIDDGAFRSSQLTHVEIPNGVTEIGEAAFHSCDKLTSVEFPTTLKSIGATAFFSCGSLTSIVIPEGVETIGEEAFSRCSELTTITLPSTLKNISKKMCYSTALAEVNYAGTQAKWKALKRGEFWDCYPYQESYFVYGEYRYEYVVNCTNGTIEVAAGWAERHEQPSIWG